MSVIYHYYAVSGKSNVDGILTLDGKVKDGGDYSELKKSIAEHFKIDVSGLIIKSLTEIT